MVSLPTDQDPPGKQNAGPEIIMLALLSLCWCIGFASALTDTSPALLHGPVLALCRAPSSRHHTENHRLLHSIDRKHGRWNKKHPRWAILEALHGYDRYRDIAGAEIDRFEDLYKHVPKKHKKILESTIQYQSNFNEARSLLDHNARLCQAIVENGLTFYNISRTELDTFIKESDNVDKKQRDNKHRVLRTHISHALKHVVRDWSLDSHDEREATFPYILNAISQNLDLSGHLNILIPGAGLGRLAHELSQLSPTIATTSNEKDAYMNLAYQYLTSPVHSVPVNFTLHPDLESWSHARSRASLYRSVSIPDSPLLLSSSNLLVEGDFTTAFQSQVGSYDAIITLLFIDTARNLVQYFETIAELLKPGGLWVNVGPLLYGSAPFVQLSLDEVVAVARETGLVIEHHTEREVMYDFGSGNLHRNGYVAQYWIARKAEGRKGWFG